MIDIALGLAVRVRLERLSLERTLRIKRPGSVYNARGKSAEEATWWREWS